MADLARRTLADQAYDELRRLIVTGTLRAGERVTERGLSVTLNVSATPIREALRRLEGEGLLERRGPRTLVIADSGPATLAQRIEVHAALRGLVARFAARYVTSQQIIDLEKILDESDDVWRLISSRGAEGLSVEPQLDRVGELTSRFNALVAESAGNPLLARLLQQAEVIDPGELAERTKLSMLMQLGPGIRRWRDDREVFEAIRAGDNEAAERIMVRHVRTALADVLGLNVDGFTDSAP